MINISSAELNALLSAFLLPLARILALVLSSPIFNHPALPLRVQVGLAMMITLVVAPTLVAPSAAIDPGSLQGLLILAQQIVIGLAMGFAIRITFVAVEAAGELAGLQMGLGYATFFDPQVAGHIPVIGRFLGLVGTLVFLSLDGHLQIIYFLSLSFSAMPIDASTLQAPTFLMLVHWGGEIFRAGVLLALPLLASLLIANLALGVLTRAAPQLNLFAVGFPLTLALGLIMLSLALPLLGPALERLFMDGLAAMQRVTAALPAVVP